MPTTPIVLHANWADGRLVLWAESADSLRAPGAPGDDEGARRHGFTLDADELRARLIDRVGEFPLSDAAPTTIRMALPTISGRPLASDRLCFAIGHEQAEVSEATVEPWSVGGVALSAEAAPVVLEALESDGDESGGMILSGSVEFAQSVGRLVRHLLVQHRFVPMLAQEADGSLRGTWQPWLGDDRAAHATAALMRSMPGSFRAVIDTHQHHPWAILDEMVRRLGDAACREALIREEMLDAVSGRGGDEAQVSWIKGLLGNGDDVEVPASFRPDVVKTVRRWIGGLEDRGASATWRLVLRLNEPLDTAELADLDAPPASLMWTISFHLRPVDAVEVTLDAADIWALSGETVNVEGWMCEHPQELLLGELGRASKLYKPLEASLDEQEPIEILLDTTEAYRFLREVRPILAEQGFTVEVPSWWESPTARLGTRLRLDDPPGEEGPGSSSAASPEIGLGTLVGYRWEIAVGDVTLTLKEFEQLAEKDTPLVRVNGRWVEIRPEDVKAAIGFIKENPGGTMAVGDALRLAYAADLEQTGVPVLGVEAGGWIGAILGGDGKSRHLPQVETPEGFHGTLRPYQQRGLSWMAFLEQFGFGLCLADDMGLGKTVQLLSLLVHERRELERKRASGAEAPPVGPTMLVVPMSVVGNWQHESNRFAPELRVTIHHGPERLQGQELLDKIHESDILITTYALANRDGDQLGQIKWHRVVLDEAQCIKNPQAKQAQAVRALTTERRIALTGTPVENRLSELWSIMDFLNPGYLGTTGTFRKRFGVPIERYRDKHKAEQLRGLVRPFVLRRLKTDSDVVSDLPEKLETKEYCHLTSEQASMYESAVSRMLGEVSEADGIHRRGLVLSTLIRLKQICNHPSQMLKDHDFGGSAPPDPRRSGKCIRLIEMIEEVLAEGQQALIFTQFRQMGHLLQSILRQQFERDVLFLHGGTPQKQREQLVRDFQRADGQHPILLLSLKAGGVGLNLTAASHVFHFDRWWNPAVEDQATDRAYRIGQTKTVQVHKFIVRGTLEERIDEMIERKMELARNIIGSGERWLTELDTDQLRDILTLRTEAVSDE
ncbi:MAG: DEAD/DEAH box helicase [Planctomycetota bacterium]